MHRRGLLLAPEAKSKTNKVNVPPVQEVSIEDDRALPVRELRVELDKLFVPDARVYWLDFLASALLFYVAFGVAAFMPWHQPGKYLCLVIAGIALYRAAVFVHELAHMPKGRMRGFGLAWNLLCGIPLLAPSFLYSSHLDHHYRSFGTRRDGEYRTWGPGSRAEILLFPLYNVLAPGAFVGRFLFLTPICWVSAPIRRWVDTRASALVMNLAYVGDPPEPDEARTWRTMEAAAFAYALAVSLSLAFRVLPLSLVIQMYLAVAVFLFLNSLRLLTAHRYQSTGAPMTSTAQVLDTMTFPRFSLWTPLWAPVGLRYHAMHHLFPSMPYHNLRAAHEYLLRRLPPDSPYALTRSDGLLASLAQLWRAAK